MIKRNIIPILFWTGVSLVSYSYFGLIGVGLTLIVVSLISLT